MPKIINNHFKIVCLVLLTLFIACKNEKHRANDKDSEPATFREQNIEFATGFLLKEHLNFKEIEVVHPWPEATDTLRYILYSKGQEKPVVPNADTFIEVPVERLVVTSTTAIPMLEFIGEESKLVGFPNTDFISSEKTRKRIDNGLIKDFGNENSMNTETVLEVNPRLIIGFTADGNTKSYDAFTRSGIPVVMNASWLEQHPLGRAEWIKFIGAFFNKDERAKQVFDSIKKKYQKAAKIAENSVNSPTVISGNMYKDIWYVPGGNSYMATFFKAAKTTYYWGDTEKTGSIALSFENVFEEAWDAELWIGSLPEKSLVDLEKSNNRYRLFDAFKNKNVYSSSQMTGEKGGMIFFELGPMRPDLILKDIIKIAHPGLIPDYELYFFKKLN